MSGAKHTPDALLAMADAAFLAGRAYRAKGMNNAADEAFNRSCELVDQAGVIKAREVE